MRNKKKRLAMMLKRQAEFQEHQTALKAIAEAKAKEEAAAQAAEKAKAEARAKAEAAAKAKAAAAVEKVEKPIHSQDLAAPEASKPLRKKSKPKTKKASK